MIAYCAKCGAMIDVPLGRPRLCPDCAAPPEPKPEQPQPEETQ